MSKYKSEWKENELNKDFWKEVLLNRTIVDVVFDVDKIKSLLLDNGEELFLFKNENGTATLYIED